MALRSNELMIGDWVYKDNTPVQILALNLFVGKEHEDIKPIPLTPEILEKNGFVEQAFIQNSIWSISGFSLECHFTTWEYYWANGDVTIGYVHELQHALRLCGIEKEIMI